MLDKGKARVRVEARYWARVTRVESVQGFRVLVGAGFWKRIQARTQVSVG